MRRTADNSSSYEIPITQASSLSRFFMAPYRSLVAAHIWQRVKRYRCYRLRSNDAPCRSLFRAKRWPKAAADRYFCGKYPPGSHRVSVRRAPRRSALDGSCSTLASRSDPGAMRADGHRRPPGLSRKARLGESRYPAKGANARLGSALLSRRVTSRASEIIRKSSNQQAEHGISWDGAVRLTRFAHLPTSGVVAASAAFRRHQPAIWGYNEPPQTGTSTLCERNPPSPRSFPASSLRLPTASGRTCRKSGVTPWAACLGVGSPPEVRECHQAISGSIQSQWIGLSPFGNSTAARQPSDVPLADCFFDSALRPALSMPRSGRTSTVSTSGHGEQSYVSIRLEASGGRHFSMDRKYEHNPAKKTGGIIKNTSSPKGRAVRSAQEYTSISI